MTDEEVQIIKDRIDKEVNWLFNVYIKENRISFDDIRIAMDGIKHTLDVELADEIYKGE